MNFGRDNRWSYCPLDQPVAGKYCKCIGVRFGCAEQLRKRYPQLAYWECALFSGLCGLGDFWGSPGTAAALWDSRLLRHTENAGRDSLGYQRGAKVWICGSRFDVADCRVALRTSTSHQCGQRHFAQGDSQGFHFYWLCSCGNRDHLLSTHIHVTEIPDPTRQDAIANNMARPASSPPNLLFLMTDQMQGRVLNPDHICQTPTFDRLRDRSVHLTHAYTPNAICSPARASLMTGLLPHNHNVWTVTHTVREDRANLRPSRHWAQYLQEAGYATGYFGKWHVERSHELAQFGWNAAMTEEHASVKWSRSETQARLDKGKWELEGHLDNIPGYARSRFYGVTDVSPELRMAGAYVKDAEEFLLTSLAYPEPWALCVSVLEPHDPFICGAEAFSRYDLADVPLSPSWQDDMVGRPEVYRRVQRAWANWTPQQHREAAACYYASITEIDQLFGRLVDRVEAAGQLDNTIVVLTSDHGELLGAHGLYCKNYTASEEIYNVPLLMSGPGMKPGTTCAARIGLHDLHPTLLELMGMPFDGSADSASFAELLADPEGTEDVPAQGFAEYEGTRFQLTQRVVWDGDWKFVLNGFALDELYNLQEDPFEMTNLLAVQCQEYEQKRIEMTRLLWDYVKRTGDQTLLGAVYPILQLPEIGPESPT